MAGQVPIWTGRLPMRKGGLLCHAARLFAQLPVIDIAGNYYKSTTLSRSSWLPSLLSAIRHLPPRPSKRNLSRRDELKLSLQTRG
ncbi:MAG: hypothetical protein FVQ81_14455 [Candidatus Glassbacteria bacterium]|nr:hypothetical protein [Candidatus Glassbacteria bacterium]